MKKAHIMEGRMFGYININKPELKVKEYYEYKAYYCGLCNTLKNRFGRFGQMTLTYDMTFLIILLSSLYESETTCEKHRCLAHPTKKHAMLQNEISEYAADMNIALSYHKMLDDWNDDKNVLKKAGSVLLLKDYKRVENKYERQCNVIKECLQKLSICEKQKETNLDIVSRSFGELMGEMFVYKEDHFSSTLRNMGFYLGKFIYLMDAYEDLPEDEKDGSYNPLLSISKQENYEEKVLEILTMMMAECTKEFEKLPLLRDAQILRNILYAGVWSKYDKLRQKCVKE